MDNPLIFPLISLKTHGRIRVAEDIPAAVFADSLEGLARLQSAVAVELQAEWRDERVWLTGRASGRWQLQCCRCLAPVAASYGAQIDEVVDEPGETIDAEEDVRQTLLLAVPTQPHCRADCKGLCAQCGQDKNLKECGCAPPSRFKLIKRGKSDA